MNKGAKVSIFYGIKLFGFLYASAFLFRTVANAGNDLELNPQNPEVLPVPELPCTVKLALVLCDQNSKYVASAFDRQLNQTLTLLKSILIATDECVHLILISNRKQNFDQVKSEIKNKWDISFRERLQFEFVPLKYPPGASWMRNLFRPCATFRLFLPEVLRHHDAILYTDTDFIFLRNIRDIWAELGNFSSNALAGMVLRPGKPFPNRVPNYGPTGVNSGIILMNLTRMRESGWTEKTMVIGRTYRGRLRFPDQDVLNIYFHNNPKEMHDLSCDWNFRCSECHRKYFCKESVSGGISALHGNGLSFIRKSVAPVFNTIFERFMTTSLNSTFELKELIGQLRSDLDGHRKRRWQSACARNPQFKNSLLRRLEEKQRRNTASAYKSK